jgi:predicted  nucleic acid-binding Zn-ribbon protein
MKLRCSSTHPASFRVWTFFVFSWILLSQWNQAIAQNANARDERKENQRVANAEKALAEVKKDLSAIQKNLKQELTQQNKDEDSLVALRKKVRQAREDAEDRLGESVGIPAALKKVRLARTELDMASAEVLAKLAMTSEWKQANAKAAEAKEQKKSLLENLELDAQDRLQTMSKLTETIARLAEIEQQAISKDPKANKANAALNGAQSELEIVRKKLPRDKIDADTQVVQIEKEISKREKSIRDLDSAITKLRNEASKVQKRMVQAQSSLKNARAADAADPNRNTKKNPKK